MTLWCSMLAHATTGGIVHHCNAQGCLTHGAWPNSDCRSLPLVQAVDVSHTATTFRKDMHRLIPRALRRCRLPLVQAMQACSVLPAATNVMIHRLQSLRCRSWLLMQVKEARSALQTAAGAAWQGDSPAFVLKRALAFACLQYGFQGSSQSGWAFQQVPVPAEQVQQHVGSVSVSATDMWSGGTS